MSTDLPDGTPAPGGDRGAVPAMIPRAEEPWWMNRLPASGRIRPGAVPGSGGLPPGGAGGAALDAPTDPERVQLVRPADSSGAPAAFMAAIAVIVLVLSARWFPSARLSRVVVPFAGLTATIAFARRLQTRHPDEPWLGSWLVLAVVVKEIASVMRYLTLVNPRGEVGDASIYDRFGARFAEAWLHKPGAVAPHLTDLKKTGFVRWFTGVVYYLFGHDLIAGYVVFALLAFVGSYLWYRATVEALPFVDRRLYFLVVFFAPSIAFWPSSIGKEALMQLAIGITALGTCHLLRGRLVRGLAVAAPGAWLLWVVRPHLLALVTLAAAGAYILGKSPRRTASAATNSSLVKPIGVVLLGFLAAFAVSQGAHSLGLPSLSLGSVQAELDATTVSTGQGKSSFNNGGNSLSPLHLPQGFVTVLLRPFPWEVSTPLQILASFEGLALAGFMVYRRKSIALSLRRMRSSPFLFYCWTLTLLYALTFQAFANFGLLVRERSLVLPALYVLLCLDPARARVDG